MSAKKNILTALAVFVFIIIAGYCTVSADSSGLLKSPVQHVSEVDFSGERLSSDSSIANAYAAAESIFCSRLSFTQIGQEKRSSKEEYRTYFYSVLAVLVKTAVIPEYILITVIGAGYLKADARGQLMSFIHDMDGKK